MSGDPTNDGGEPPSATSTRHRSADQLHPVARTPEEWRTVLEGWGERGFRGSQVFRWIHAHGELDPEKMTNLSKPLRARLREAGLGPAAAQVEELQRASDGTRKLLLAMEDGARVECVLIPMTKEPEADAAALVDDDEDEPLHQRVTLCISTQHGCAMGCVFCASGRVGLRRGLGAAEIAAQVLVARRYLDEGEVLQNLVFMGMGEPLHHYDETARALRLLTHPDGAGMSPRRITVSTVGLIPGIRRLGEDFQGKVGLAISLHAATDEVRSRLVPMNRRYPIAALMEALRAYPLPQRRRITIEYTLIDGVNADLPQARALARLLAKLRVKINLIPLNRVAGSEWAPPPDPTVQAFREVLANAGYSCFVRTRRGDDVSAACGQLAMHDDLVRIAPQRDDPEP